MRRFLTLVCLLCLAVPAGISVSGCYRNPGANYCNGLGYGTKIGDVASITLQPQTTGISLAFGQTQQIATPTAYDCKGSGASVSNWAYGTSNNQLVDISPSGMLCAGTWNRNSGGGIADYTTCNKPNPLPTTSGLPYAVAYITASASSVTSNPVKVYVHSQVTSIALAGVTQQCYSQTQTASLDAQACYADATGTQYQLCAPAGYQPLGTQGATKVDACPLPAGMTQAALPTCSTAIGALSYSVGNSTVGSIDSSTNIITASMPGTTSINASIAGSASSAGYFSVCPPRSITLTTASGATSATVTQGVSQTLVSAVTDTNGSAITGLSLDYNTSNPVDITAAAGTITAIHPGVATLYASCQPSLCNASPINEIGLFATGLPSSSNPVTITTPGATSDYVWFGAPNNSQYFVAIDLLTGTAGSTVKLPYVPNSMLMDKTGTSLYFGSSHGLMAYSTSNDALTKQDASVPGLVLTVSPNNSYALINDQSRGILYLYNIGSGTSQTFTGMAVAAAWTTDSKTMYAVDSASAGTGHTNTLYVYSINTGWSSYDLSNNGPNAADSGAWAVTAMIPGIGAYLSGPYTQSRGWCPAGTVGSSANQVLYPEADPTGPLAVQNDVLATTNDGKHILGATQSSGNIILNDLAVTIPTQQVGSIQVPVTCPYSVNATTGVQSLNGLNFATTVSPTTLAISNATAINQVVTAPVSNLTFVTYSAPSSATSTQLPFYLPAASGPGQVGYVTLSGASAPLAGAFSPDNSIFFVSTQGDNKIHFLTIPATVTSSTKLQDSQQISPNLPACSASTDSGCTYTGSGAVVPATVITVIPRATT